MLPPTSKTKQERERERDRDRERHRERETDRQTDRQTERERDRQTDRQTDRRLGYKTIALNLDLKPRSRQTPSRRLIPRPVADRLL